MQFVVAGLCVLPLGIVSARVEARAAVLRWDGAGGCERDRLCMPLVQSGRSLRAPGKLQGRLRGAWRASWHLFDVPCVLPCG